MKKLLAVSLFVSFSLAASAAMEKVATIQINNTTALVKSVNEIGKMAGNQALTGILTGALMQNAFVEEFGPMRTGADASVLVAFYLDEAKVNLTNAECSTFTILYPAAGGKGKVLKRHEGAVQTNGVVRIGDDDYLAFSKDGKWVAKADSAALAKAALGDIQTVQKSALAASTLAKFKVNSKGIAALVKACEAAKAKDPDSAFVADYYRDLLKMFSSFSCSLAVVPQGVDFQGELKPVAGTELAKLGLKGLPADILKTVDRNALGVDCFATDMGTGSAIQTWKDIIAALKKSGLDVSPFISVEAQGRAQKMILDPVALVRMAKAESNNVFKAWFEKIASQGDNPAFFDNLQKDLEPTIKRQCAAGFKADGEPMLSMVIIKGLVPKYSPAERFAATFPGCVPTNMIHLSASSYVAMVKSIVQVVEKELDEEMKAMVSPFVAQLPEENKGGIAAYARSEKGKIVFRARISSDEIKGFGDVVNIAIQAMMMGAIGNADDDDDDDDEFDDEDEDDDED